MANETQKSAQPGARTVELDDFDALLKKNFNPRDTDSEQRIKTGVQTLIQLAVQPDRAVESNAFATVDAFIAEIDRKLSEQINEILHHPKFQEMESTWRGLRYLVENSPTTTQTKIQVLNITKAELRGLTEAYAGGDWDQSPLHRQIYDKQFGTLGGQPFGTVVCDYYFDYSDADIDIMRMLGKIGEDAHCPFVAAASPSLFRLDGWSGLDEVQDVGRLFEGPQYAKWHGFRNSDASRYLALAMPRFLGRPVYGPEGKPVDAFNFVEDTGKGEAGKFLWVNSAFALGSRIIQSFVDYGWGTRFRGVESGGTITSLPTARFKTDLGADAKAPVEISISDRRERELSTAGFISLIHRQNTDEATFMSAQSTHKPSTYVNKDDTANDRLSSNLQYIFASSRFAHYLKAMVRDWIGGSHEERDLQTRLTTWLNGFVDAQPDNSTEETKARKPLRDAEITVIPDEERPGSYQAKFRMRPHIFFEEMDIGLSMVARLPESPK